LRRKLNGRYVTSLLCIENIFILIYINSIIHNFIVCFKANTTLVRYLISKGADVSIQDEFGRTPLFIASGLENWAVVETVVAACHTVDTRFVD